MPPPTNATHSSRTTAIKHTCIFMLAVICLAASALAEYSALGNGNAYDLTGSMTRWSPDLLEETFSYYQLSDPGTLPLVGDMDGDGTNEILILEGDGLSVFHYDGDLMPVGGLSFPAQCYSGAYYSNPVLFDIDKDGLPEYIIHSQLNNSFLMVSMNESGLYLSKLAGPEGMTRSCVDTHITSDSMLGCGHGGASNPGCALVYNSRNTYQNAVTMYSYMVAFNSTHKGAPRAMHTVSSYPPCFASVPSVSWDDYSNRYFWTSITGSGGSRSRLYAASVQANYSVGTPSVGTHSHTELVPGTNCGRGVKSLTSPTLLEFKLGAYAGPEAVWAYNKDVDEYKMLSMSQSLVEIDEYPDVDNGMGRFISNPFQANAFRESGDNTGVHDVCIIGYDPVISTFDVLCATESENLFSLFGLTLLDNAGYDVGKPAASFNFTEHNPVFAAVAHSIQSPGTGDISEVLTPYGIIKLDDLADSNDACKFFGGCAATWYWNLSEEVNEEMAVIAADVEGNGYLDLVAMSKNSLIYVDDGFVNRLPYMGYGSKIDPCLTLAGVPVTWKINTTVRVTVLIQDVDTTDAVAARATLYAGGPNEQVTGWSVNTTPGHYVVLPDMNVNESESGARLVVEITDWEHGNATVQYNYSFSASPSGTVERGDCNTLVGITEEEYEEGQDPSVGAACSTDADCADDQLCYENACQDLPTEADNTITRTANQISYVVGVPVLILALGIMALVAFLVFRSNMEPGHKFLGALLILLLMAGIGVKIGIFGPLWLILIILIVLAGVGISVASRTQGGG